MNSSGHARLRTTNQVVWLALALVIVGILGGLLGYTFEGVDAVIAAGLAAYAKTGNLREASRVSGAPFSSLRRAYLETTGFLKVSCYSLVELS